MRIGRTAFPMNPLISIIIVNWNRQDLLRQCLDSIDEHAKNITTETIIVDNASTDNSADYVEENHKLVRLIRNKTNRGFAFANNQGLAIAQGKYILFLNSDTVLLQSSIEELLDVFKNSPKVGLCAPKLLNPNGSTQANVYRFSTFRAMSARYTFLKYFGLFKKNRDSYRMRDFAYDRITQIDRPMGAAMMADKKILNEVGGMDEKLYFYFEEVELCKRIKDAGYEVYFTPNSKIIHYGRASSNVLSRACREALFFKSMFYYFRKHKGRAKTFFFSLIFKPAVLLYMLCEIFLGVFDGLVCLCSNRQKAKRKLQKSKEAMLFISKYGLRFIFY